MYLQLQKTSRRTNKKIRWFYSDLIVQGRRGKCVCASVSVCLSVYVCLYGYFPPGLRRPGFRSPFRHEDCSVILISCSLFT